MNPETAPEFMDFVVGIKPVSPKTKMMIASARSASPYWKLIGMGAEITPEQEQWLADKGYDFAITILDNGEYRVSRKARG